MFFSASLLSFAKGFQKPVKTIYLYSVQATCTGYKLMRETVLLKTNRNNLLIALPSKKKCHDSIK